MHRPSLQVRPLTLTAPERVSPLSHARISAKDLKNMLSQVNYRVPNMRFLRERLTVSCGPAVLPPHWGASAEGVLSWDETWWC